MTKITLHQGHVLTILRSMLSEVEVINHKSGGME